MNLAPLHTAETPVFIVSLSSERATAMFPAIRNLPVRQQVFVVVTEAGRPLLVTDTRAEAVRQVSGQRQFRLSACH